MKLHLPLPLHRLLLPMASCFSVVVADIVLPEGYVPVEINSAEDFADLTPEVSVNYAFMVADGGSLSTGVGETLLPEGAGVAVRQ